MDIVGGKIGAEGSWDVSFVGGALVAKAGWAKDGVDVETAIKVDSDLVLDALAKAIPGTLDDAIIAVVKAALKSLG